jgi:hypothetical protein
MFSQDLLTSIVETATIAVPCLFLLDMAAKIENLSAKLDQVVETLASKAVETPVAETVETPVAETVETQVPETPAKKRGRPKGSKNKPKVTAEAPATEAPATETVETPATETVETPPKKRGRPKGSKNKPKVTQVPEVVQTQVTETQVTETQVTETQVTDAGLAETPSPAYQAPSPAETVRSKTKTRASYKATQDKALVVKTEPTGRIITATEARGLCKTQEVLAKINGRWCRVTGVGSNTVSCTRGVWANHDQVNAWLAIG